jgi:hypothetical protein
MAFPVGFHDRKAGLLRNFWQERVRRGISVS